MDVCSKNGAILLFDKISIDGSAPGAPIRVQSHDHADHGMGSNNKLFLRSLQNHKEIVIHKASWDLIKASQDEITRSRLDLTSNLKDIEYGEKKIVILDKKEYEISLYNNNHVLGSSQILIKNLSNGKRVLYSSDIGPNVDVFPETDELIIDSTCGHLNSHIFRNHDESFQDFLDHLQAKANEFPERPIQINTHRGTMEKVLEKICEIFRSKQIYAETNILKTLDIYRDYGYGFNSKQIMECKKKVILDDPYQYIYLSTTMPSKKSSIHNNKKIIYYTLHGLHSNSEESVREVGSIGEAYDCYLTEHANYEVTKNYILETKAKKVYIDNIRNESKAAPLLNKLESDYLDGYFNGREIQFRILEKS
jgi:hypothetical protein